MRRFLRVLIGFAAACVAASTTALLFAVTPAELFALPWDAAVDRIGWIADTSWKLAILFAMVAVLPALPAILSGERRTVRGWRYYALIGMGIAIVGYGAQAITTLTSTPLMAVAYTALAYSMTGVVAGSIYWMIAGRLAGEPEERAPVKTVWRVRAARGRRSPPSL